MSLFQVSLIFAYRHLDHHKLWDPNEFAVSCFKIIMYSIQVGFSPVVFFFFLAYMLQAHERDLNARLTMLVVDSR